MWIRTCGSLVMTFGSLVHQNMSLWEILKLKENFQKNKVSTGKTPFSVIGPICSIIILFVLRLAFDTAVFYGNNALSVLVFSTKRRVSSFLIKVFIFQKICFKVTILKTFKISTDCHIKICRSLKRRAILKIPSTVF